MVDVEKEQEPEETGEKDTYPCPNCGEPQKLFIDRRMGWVRCPSCDTGIKKSEIPEDYQHLIKKVPYKRGDKPRDGDEIDEELEDDDSPFERPLPAWKILSTVLKQFTVPDRARTLMVTRCKRDPQSPSDIYRMLSDLKTGLQKNEVTYVVEEYAYALKGEARKRKSAGEPRLFDFDLGDDDDDEYYPPSTPQRRGGSPSDPPPTVPWERRRQKKGGINRDELLEILDKRERRREEKDKFGQLQDGIMAMGDAIRDLQNQSANPPKDDDKIYKLMSEQHKERMAMMAESAQDRSALTEKLHETQMNQSQQMVDFYKDQASSKPVKLDTSGYKDDGARLLAESINSAANVLAQNKPLVTTAKAIAVPIPPRSEIEVKHKKEGHLGILSQLDDAGFVDEE